MQLVSHSTKRCHQRVARASRSMNLNREYRTYISPPSPSGARKVAIAVALTLVGTMLGLATCNALIMWTRSIQHPSRHVAITAVDEDGRSRTSIALSAERLRWVDELDGASEEDDGEPRGEQRHDAWVADRDSSDVNA